MGRKAMIRATAKLAESNPNMGDMPQGSTHWRVTLRYMGRRMTVPFSMGPAHSGEPGASDVLECLCMDATCPDNFEDFCAELGYDPDSRKAERTHRAILRQTAGLRRLLGADFDSIVYSDEGDRARLTASTRAR